jgi:uncharacterized phage protein gp47/JayE
MLDRVPAMFDKREGSIIWDALAPAAVELQLMYIELDDILSESFADTATRDFLIRRAAERDIRPFPASKAVLRGVFAPPEIDVIGQRFSGELLNYVVTEKLSDSVYAMECETSGVQGNQYFGQIIPIDYIHGLESAELTGLLIPGEDDEDTESLRQRYLASFDARAYGGNIQDYVEKVSAIPGVARPKITPVWAGGGTVKVTILDSDYNKATEMLVAAVQETLDPPPQGMGLGVAPIGHTVTVEAAPEIPVNISTSLALENGYFWENIRPQAEELIESYFLELRRQWTLQSYQEHLVVRISQIETRILNIKGVLDITGTNLNGFSMNLALGAYEIPTLGGISA